MHWLLRALTMAATCAADGYTLSTPISRSGKSAARPGSTLTTQAIGRRSDGVSMSAATATFQLRHATSNQADQLELPLWVAIPRAHSCTAPRPADTACVSP